MKETLRRINLRILLIIILTFVLGWQFGQKSISWQWANYHPTVSVTDKTPPSNINVDFKLFWNIWDLVSQEYLDKTAIDPQKMFYGAIQGMVAAIGDPYTVFLPPQQQKVTQEELNGSFEGIGIQIGFNKDKQLVVVAPLSETPADKAGLKPGDIIVKIDGQDTSNISLPEAVQLIRGPKGSEITMTIYRDGEAAPRDVKLVRDTIVVKSVDVAFKKTATEKNIAVIKLSRFGDRTESEWNGAVSKVLSQGADGVVLDLRNNPGGYLQGAVFIASEFLREGPVVIQENNKGEKVTYSVDRQGKLLNQPLVVLINKGSASASEIVAGALQDRGRAKLVGSQSFGKGTIQEAQNLPQGTGIHITIARWLTPDGHWVNETDGLSPDVNLKEDTADPTKDPQLEGALELLK